MAGEGVALGEHLRAGGLEPGDPGVQLPGLRLGERLRRCGVGRHRHPERQTVPFGVSTRASRLGTRGSGPGAPARAAWPARERAAWRRRRRAAAPGRRSPVRRRNPPGHATLPNRGPRRPSTRRHRPGAACRPPRTCRIGRRGRRAAPRPPPAAPRARPARGTRHGPRRGPRRHRRAARGRRAGAPPGRRRGQLAAETDDLCGQDRSRPPAVGLDAGGAGRTGDRRRDRVPGPRRSRSCRPLTGQRGDVATDAGQLARHCSGVPLGGGELVRGDGCGPAGRCGRCRLGGLGGVGALGLGARLGVGPTGRGPRRLGRGHGRHRRRPGGAQPRPQCVVLRPDPGEGGAQTIAIGRGRGQIGPDGGQAAALLGELRDDGRMALGVHTLVLGQLVAHRRELGGERIGLPRARSTAPASSSLRASAAATRASSSLRRACSASSSASTARSRATAASSCRRASSSRWTRSPSRTATRLLERRRLGLTLGAERVQPSGEVGLCGAGAARSASEAASVEARRCSRSCPSALDPGDLAGQLGGPSLVGRGRRRRVGDELVQLGVRGAQPDRFVGEVLDGGLGGMVAALTAASSAAVASARWPVSATTRASAAASSSWRIRAAARRYRHHIVEHDEREDERSGHDGQRFKGELEHGGGEPERTRAAGSRRPGR